MSQEGRVLIPATLRRKLEMNPGEDLVARVEDGKLILESRANILKRLQGRFAHIPNQVSLSDEQIAERRRESTSDKDALTSTRP